jgi:hypothetical protein
MPKISIVLRIIADAKYPFMGIKKAVNILFGNEHPYRAPGRIIIGSNYKAGINAFSVFGVLLLIELTLRAYRHTITKHRAVKPLKIYYEKGV